MHDHKPLGGLEVCDATSVCMHACKSDLQAKLDIIRRWVESRASHVECMICSSHGYTH